MNKKQKAELELLSGPGDTLAETLMVKAKAYFAYKCELSHSDLEDILSNKLPITYAIAVKLEKGTEIHRDFWVNRWNNYKQKLDKITT